MYILKSILNQAGAVWQVESIAMMKRDAERLLRSRLASSDGKLLVVNDLTGPGFPKSLIVKDLRK